MIQHGEGSALFDLTVDGDLTLSGQEPCHSNSEFSWDEFGQRLCTNEIKQKNFRVFFFP